MNCPVATAALIDVVDLIHDDVTTRSSNLFIIIYFFLFFFITFSHECCGGLGLLIKQQYCIRVRHGVLLHVLEGAVISDVIDDVIR